MPVIKMNLDGEDFFFDPAENQHVSPDFWAQGEPVEAIPERPQRRGNFPGMPALRREAGQDAGPSGYNTANRNDYPPAYAPTFQPCGAMQPAPRRFNLPREALQSSNPVPEVVIAPPVQHSPTPAVQPLQVAGSPSPASTGTMLPGCSAMRPYLIPASIVAAGLLGLGGYLAYRKMSEVAAEPFSAGAYTYPTYSYP